VTLHSRSGAPRRITIDENDVDARGNPRDNVKGGRFTVGISAVASNPVQ